MNAPTKGKVSLLVRTSSASVEPQGRHIKHRLTIVGLYRTTYSRYRNFLKKSLNEKYSTNTHVLHGDVKCSMVAENVCDIEFTLVPLGN